MTDSRSASRARQSSLHTALLSWRPYIDRWLLLVMAGALILFAGLSIMRYRAYNAGMLDLGNMSQAIWSATRGKPLEFTYGIGPVSRLSFHVEVIYLLLALPYALIPRPETLLVVQSLLFVSAAVPLYRLAQRRVGHLKSARLITLIYLCYPVAQTAVLFDIHGDTLAMPFLLFAIEAVDRSAWRPYVVWLGLALSCKHYVAVAVVAMGATLFLTGRRRAGVLTSIAGLVWGTIAFLVLRPLFAPSGYQPAEVSAAGYVGVYFGRISELLDLGFLLPRIATGIIVFGPALWLGRRAWPWFTPALAIGLPALSAFGSVSAHDYRYHHYALAVPFLVVSIVYGAERLRRLRNRRSEHNTGTPWPRQVGMQFAIVLVFSVILVDTPLNPLFWSGARGWGRDPYAYGRSSRDAMRDQWLADYVPADAPLMASFFAAPHVVNRSVLFLPQANSETLLHGRIDKVDFAVVDALFDFRWMPGELSGGVSFGHPAPVDGGVLYDVDAIRALLERSDCGLVEAQDGMLLFDCRNCDSGPALAQSVITGNAEIGNEPIVVFGDEIGLIDYRILSLGGRQFELQFDWVPLKPLAELPARVAVSRLTGVTDARVVHLPTLTLYPTVAWRIGEVVRERVSVVFPDDAVAGEHELVLGWYDTDNTWAAQTDARSRIGAEVQLGSVRLAGRGRD